MDDITLGAMVVGGVKVVIFKVFNCVVMALDHQSIKQLDKLAARLATLFFSTILHSSSRS